jgi:hypothetical protein
MVNKNTAQFCRFQPMVYNSRDWLILVLYPLSDSTENNVSETGSVSVRRWNCGRHLLSWRLYKELTSVAAQYCSGLRFIYSCRYSDWGYHLLMELKEPAQSALSHEATDSISKTLCSLVQNAAFLSRLRTKSKKKKSVISKVRTYISFPIITWSKLRHCGGNGFPAQKFMFRFTSGLVFCLGI